MGYIICLFIGLILGTGFCYAAIKIRQSRQEPIIGELHKAYDGENSVLYLELNNEDSITIASSCELIRLKVHESLNSH